MFEVTFKASDGKTYSLEAEYEALFDENDIALEQVEDVRIFDARGLEVTDSNQPYIYWEILGRLEQALTELEAYELENTEDSEVA